MHGRAIQFAGEERFMNVLWILIILKWLSIIIESWQAFKFFGVKPYMNSSEPP